MNSHFRKDYAYTLTLPLAGLDKKIAVRYLNYDRKRKEYVFVEGLTRKQDEFQFRFTQAQALSAIRRADKKHCIGYGPTKWYNPITSKYEKPYREIVKDRATKPLKLVEEVKTTKINKFNDLELGGTYKIKRLDTSIYIDDGTYTLNDLDFEAATIRKDDGLEQMFHYFWLEDGLIEVVKVG